MLFSLNIYLPTLVHCFFFLFKWKINLRYPGRFSDINPRGKKSSATIYPKKTLLLVKKLVGHSLKNFDIFRSKKLKIQNKVKTEKSTFPYRTPNLLTILLRSETQNDTMIPIVTFLWRTSPPRAPSEGPWSRHL